MVINISRNAHSGNNSTLRRLASYFPFFSAVSNCKVKIMASGPITSWEIDGKTLETVTDFILGGAPK